MVRPSPSRPSRFPDPAVARLKRRARVAWVLLSLGVVSAFVPVPQARADASITGTHAGSAPSEPGEPLVLALQLEGVPLDALLSVLERGPRVLVPLGELSRVIGLAIQVEPEQGVAEGFFISEARRFRLDVAARQVRCGKHEFPWDSAGIAVQPDDIYLATGLLDSWFGLEITVRHRAAALEVRSRELLPIQARAERARRMQRALAGGDPVLSASPRVRTPYRAWGGPFVDQEFRSWTAHGDRQRISGWQSATYLTADLLYMETDLHLRGDQRNPFADLRAGAGRRDPRPVLLGPLHARQFRFGEVGYPGLPLVARSVAGPGFLLSNYPLQRSSQFGEHTFRGRLADGWDVELHRDGALIAYRESRPDGTYQFDRVPLLYGLNDFRLVFHGPHGERREESEVFNVGRTLNPPGQLNYRLVAGDVTDSSRRAHLETDLHLAGNLSGSFALATVGLEDGAHHYAAAGVRGFWNRCFAGADVAVSSTGGQVAELGLQARSRRLGASVRHAALANGFRSDVFRSGIGAVERRTTGLLDGLVTPHRAVRIPLQVELTSERLSGGQALHAWATRVGLGYRHASLSHQMRQVVARRPGVAPDGEAQRSLLMSVNVRRWALRGAADYAHLTRDGWQNARLSAEGPAFGDVYAGLGLARDRISSDTRVSADLRTSQGAFGWSARAEFGPNRRLSLSLALSVGLNREPRGGGWHAHARPVARQGAASAQVFLDANGSGARDPGEEPLPGVGLVVNRVHGPQRTDDQGVVFLSGLPSEEEVEIQLATQSLEDPLWMSKGSGLRIAPRPGRTALVDFPVVISGEVAGTVSVRRAGGTHSAPGVNLELVDAATGEVVKRISTAYDGYFDLLAIPPGRYQLRIAATQLRRFGLSAGPRRPIEIAPTGTLLEGVDLVIEPEPVTREGP